MEVRSMKGFGQWVRDGGLRFRLTMVMLILLFCSMGIVFIPYYWGRENLKADLEKRFLDLSNAIRVSIDQLTAPAASGQDRLREYVESLRKSGIREVSIVGEDMGVIDSTNPGAIGRTARIKLPPEKLIINATFGEEPDPGEEKLRSRDLVIPVTVGGDDLGFIHVRMQIDDFAEPIRKNLYLRSASTLAIFAVGFALAVIISAHYVRTLERLAMAAEKVAAGDLSQELPVGGKDEVGRLTRSFNEMVERLRRNRELEEKVRESQYLSQLGRLASGVAHEIRNPLNFIALAVDHLDTLTRGKTEEGDREKEAVLTGIRGEIRNLNDLVTNFILYGRPPEPQRTPVRIRELVEGVLQMAAPRLQEHRISLVADFQEAPPLAVDPDMIRRAIINLVGNAVDAMSGGGELRIVGAMQEEGGYRLEIRDTGIGISEEDLERLFEPYFTTKSTGLGLGMVLTRKIVEAHGGTIVVDSEPGRGTRVTIRLPGDNAA
jgi:signal transduction histidine kinase